MSTDCSVPTIQVLAIAVIYPYRFIAVVLNVLSNKIAESHGMMDALLEMNILYLTIHFGRNT